MNIAGLRVPVIASDGSVVMRDATVGEAVTAVLGLHGFTQDILSGIAGIIDQFLDSSFDERKAKGDIIFGGAMAAVTLIPIEGAVVAPISAAETTAARTGTELSTIRYTQPGETFIRYESGNPAFTKITPTGGVKPGTYAAPASDGIIPVADRVPVYNLPSPQIPRPDVIIIRPPPGTPIIGPRSVVGGTGNEVIFPAGSP